MLLLNVSSQHCKTQDDADHIPTVLHVLWFVDPNGDPDLEVFVRTVLCRLQLMPFGCFWTRSGWIENHLSTENLK